MDVNYLYVLIITNAFVSGITPLVIIKCTSNKFHQKISESSIKIM